MKVGLAQINTIVGDLEGNRQKILRKSPYQSPRQILNVRSQCFYLVGAEFSGNARA